MDSLALSDDQGAGDTVFAGREPLLVAPEDDHRGGAGRNPLVGDGIRACDVDDVESAGDAVFEPSTASRQMWAPSTTIEREPRKQLSSTMTGAACTGFEDAADSDAAREVDVPSDLGAGDRP